MTALSVNLNKIALLRNSRGHNHPHVLDFARRFIALGVDGITVHPRPDERHIKRHDAVDLAAMLQDYPGIEFNIEGYPSEAFLSLIEQTRPHQCTLVPDAEAQLTSDHGWNFYRQAGQVGEAVAFLKSLGVRSSVFLDPDPEQIPLVLESGADRIELFTERYALDAGTDRMQATLEDYRQTAQAAVKAGLGVNAGHDLNLQNLRDFLAIGKVLEVSIGHALVVECLERGMETVVSEYLAICHAK